MDLCEKKMNCFKSSEVRWFFPPGRQNVENVREWFFSIPNAIIEEQTTRTDFYYRLSESSTFGIKLRMEGGGKAETKEQFRDYGPVRYHDQVEGRVNDWTKWSFSLNEPGVTREDLAANWLAVEKDRWLQKYRIEQVSAGPLQITAVPAKEFPPTGFGLELTRVRAAGQEWLTIGFEAFDVYDNQREMLDAGVRYILQQAEAPLFALAESSSYYRWLAEYFVGRI